MRQIGDDFAVDPREPASSAEIGDPVMTPALMRDHKAWLRNTFATRAHAFCSKTLNFSEGVFTDSETNNFNACLNKYKNAYGLFTQEQNLF